MKNELAVVNEQEVMNKNFKVYGSIDEPLFLAKDVANWIEHSDTSKMVRSLDDDEKMMGTMFLSAFQQRLLQKMDYTKF